MKGLGQVLLCICLIQSVLADDDNGNGSEVCPNLPPAKLSRKWFDANNRQTWYVPLAGKLDSSSSSSNQNFTVALSMMSSRRCYTASINTPRGTLQVPFQCSFEKHSDMSCVLRTEQTRLRNRLKFFGDFTITKTDNRTYIVVLACILPEGRKYWMMLSRIPYIKDLLMEEVLAHVEANGFDREELSDLQDDPFALYKLQGTRCKPNDFPDYDEDDEAGNARINKEDGDSRDRYRGRRYQRRGRGRGRGRGRNVDVDNTYNAQYKPWSRPGEKQRAETQNEEKVTTPKSTDEIETTDAKDKDDTKKKDNDVPSTDGIVETVRRILKNINIGGTTKDED